MYRLAGTKQDPLLERSTPAHSLMAHSHISSLPTEVLCMIFEAGQTLSAEYPFEILISQVTRRWREAAIGHARLWKRVVFDTSARHAKEIGNRYLDRSGTLPIDIIYRIIQPSNDISHEMHIVTSMSALIYAQVGRWDRVLIKTDWVMALSYFLTNLPTKALLLRSLEVLTKDNLESPEHGLPSRIFIDGTPELKSLLLRNVKSRCV